MTADSLGNPLSCDPAAVPALERAARKMHLYQADPIAEVDALLAEHPDCAMALALRAGALVAAPLRELAETAYMFTAPFVLDSAASQARLGLAPTPVEVGAKATVDWWRTRS